MNRQHALTGVLFLVCFFFTLSACPVMAAPVYPGDPNYWRLVYPDDPYWRLETRGSGGNGIISADNPRSGNASLKLTTGGNLEDWAFYSRYANPSDPLSGSWGLLSDITDLAFDWYRETPLDDHIGDFNPWNLQTPVLRLLVRDQVESTAYFSELVWEKYYTEPNAIPIGQWVEQDLSSENFWRYVMLEGYTVGSGANMENFTPNPLMALSHGSWARSQTMDLPYSVAAVVYGLSVGVGSNWPGPYTGFVDNIFLAFGDEAAIRDNFEVPVPEPATFLLLGIGLTVFGIGRMRWSKKRKS